MKTLTAVSFVIFSSVWFASSLRAEPLARVRDSYVFTDEKAVVELPPTIAAIEYSIKTMTRAGWGPTREKQGIPVAGHLEITPLTEGIHTVELQTQPPQTVRFLAMQPPSPMSRKQLLQALPRTGRKLLSGEPFRILSMGDSVTNTGDYESLLVKMLARATGNRNISFVDRSYSGRSVDASVREWVNDGPPNHPDLGLLMYGLNDQITNVPLDAYLEQYAWIAKRLHETGADCVFLQPTPDIGIALNEAQHKPDSNAPPYILRTLGFGEALRPLARDLKVPLAETFHAVWGSGGATLEDSARQMQPVFPPGYDRQMESLLETGGGGDTIHLNVLGHLQIARAVFESLAGVHQSSPWQWQAVTRWTPQGAISFVTARNTSKARRTGRLEVQPPTDARLEAAPVAYDLAPGQQVRFSVFWPQATKPADLLRYPNDVYLSAARPLLPIVDFVKGSSRVYGVTSPFQPEAALVRERQTVTGNQTTVSYTVNGKRQTLPVTIPANSEVGRIPLVQKVKRAGQTGWAVGELAYVRYGAARNGEATVDGNLDEWDDALWVPVGEASQARSRQGPEDNRANLQECYLRWAFKAGRDGIYLACRAVGNIEKDSFTLFFDPRPPALLGTVGRYYWVSGTLKPDNGMEIGPGETTKIAAGLKSAWKKSENGGTLEIFVPYAAMDATTWLASGDLGVSLIWTHLAADGKRTTLLWSENGHWWNPRWYGVVRRTDAPNPTLPFMVRVR